MNRLLLLRRVYSTFLLSMFCVLAFAQGKQITGVIKDGTGEPMIGVNVLVKGTTNGTITDFDGKFAISDVKNSDVLTITYVGYVQQSIPVGNQTSFNIILKEDTETLDEVVVIGYGTVKKRDLTGSVASVSNETLTANPVSDVSQALQGKLAGVSVVSQDGRPGAEVSIRVRGGGSITQSNDPLFIVDGFPVSSISDIPADQIETIDVLKDASSTAIYGARGANGVVIITTKKGKVGKAQITYDGSVTMQHVTRTIPMMDAYEFVKLQAETYPASIANSTGGYLMEYQGKQWTLEDYRDIFQDDWQDEILRTALQHNHNIRITGGTEGVRYNASVSYYNQDGILLNSGYERFQARANTVVKRDKLDISLTTNYSRSIQTGSTPSETSYSGMNNLFYSVWGYRPVTYPNKSMESLLNDVMDEAIDSSNDYRFNPIRSLKEEYRKYYINTILR